MLFRYFVYILHIFLQEFVQFMCHKFPARFGSTIGDLWDICGLSVD